MADLSSLLNRPREVDFSGGASQAMVQNDMEHVEFWIGSAADYDALWAGGTADMGAFNGDANTIYFITA